MGLVLLATVPAPEKPKRRRSRLVLAALAVIFIFLLVFKIVPPVNGRVINALTGEPIRGIGLTLGASHYRGFSVHTSVNHHTTTGVFGWFILFPSLDWRLFPTQFRTYWVSANSGGQEMELYTASNLILYSPLANRRNAPPTDKRYFPVTISFGKQGCEQSRVWWPTCIYSSFWSGISISLIPVLDDPNECMKIGNPSLRASCRELNTYRAAFVHVDSYEEVKHGRELCNQVDQSEISKTCLERLQLYIANAGFDQKPFKPQVNEPIPEDMFPDSIAGVPAMQNRHCGPQLFFTGRIDCAGSYGSAGKHLVAVYVAQWPESEPSSAPPVFTHIETTMAPTKERHAGSIVTRYQGKWGSAEQRPDGTILSYQHQSNAFVWYSNNRFLEIVFYDPIPQQEQFLSYYLRRYPGGSD